MKSWLRTKKRKDDRITLLDSQENSQNMWKGEKTLNVCYKFYEKNYHWLKKLFLENVILFRFIKPIA